MAKKVSVVVPDLGDFKDVNVIELLVKPGDVVAVDTPLITLETEKATMDVPSTAAGRVVEIKLRKGDKVSKGDVVLLLETPSAERAPAAPEPAGAAAVRGAGARARGAARSPAPAPAATAALPPPSVAIAASAASPSMARVETPSGTRPPVDEAGFARAHASPSVRRFARELGVDLARVKGSATKGRITHDDVKAFVKASMAQASRPTGGRLRRCRACPWSISRPSVPSRSGRSAGSRRSRVAAACELGQPAARDAVRRGRHHRPRGHARAPEAGGGREGAQAHAARLHPARRGGGAGALPAVQHLPGCDDGQNLVFKRYCHLGFAADTPNGLMVPVIRDADRKDIYELARSLGELSEKARLGKLSGGRDAGRVLHGLEPGRHRRHGVHAHHQCAGSCHPRRVPVVDEARVARRAVRAAADAAAVAVLRSPRHRRRRRPRASRACSRRRCHVTLPQALVEAVP